MKKMLENISIVGATLDESCAQSRTWKTKVEKLSTMVSQLVEVEEFGPKKFFQENPLQHVDASLIQILRKNIAWRVSNYTSTFSIM